MKKIIYSVLFALVTAFALSSCTEENIAPQGGPDGSSDPCQFGGAGCK